MTPLGWWLAGPRRPPVCVLTPSVTASWLPGAPYSRYASDVMWRLTKAAAAVPVSWPADLAALLLRAERSRRATRAGVDHFLAGLLDYPIQIDLATPAHAWGEILALARTHRVSVDAAYLELARRLGVPLATVDPPLVRAAPAAGVPIFAP